MNIQYRITKLDEVRYRFNFDYDYTSLDKEKVVFQFSHVIDTNKERSEIILEVHVKFVIDGTEEPLAEQAVRASFYVCPYDDVVREKNGNRIKINTPELMDTFANVTIGALRGMIAKNLKGTALEGCILPLIPMDLLHNMIVGKE